MNKKETLPCQTIVPWIPLPHQRNAVEPAVHFSVLLDVVPITIIPTVDILFQHQLLSNGRHCVITTLEETQLSYIEKNTQALFCGFVFDDVLDDPLENLSKFPAFFSGRHDNIAMFLPGEYSDTGEMVSLQKCATLSDDIRNNCDIVILAQNEMLSDQIKQL
jgi:hypothetical protein